MFDALTDGEIVVLVYLFFLASILAVSGWLADVLARRELDKKKRFRLFRGDL